MKVRAYLRSDILVIGGGIAGCRAALEANEFAAEVVVVDQGVVGRTEPATAGEAVYAAPVPTQIPGDTWQTFRDDWLDYAGSRADRELVGMLARESLREAWDLDRFGFQWQRENDGLFSLRPVEGHRFPRGLYSAKIDNSFSGVLGDSVRNRVGIQVVDNVYITTLLQHKDRAVGAVGIDLETDSLVVFSAGCTVLATGGMDGLRAFAAGRGSGTAMARRLGATVIPPDFHVPGDGQPGTAISGGLKIDRFARTTLPGLYAAGESVAGIHGPRPLPGSHLVAAAVLGATAGRSAALTRTPVPRIKEEGVKEEILRLRRLMRYAGRKRDDVPTVSQLAAELNQMFAAGAEAAASSNEWHQLARWLDEHGEEWSRKAYISTDELSLKDMVATVEVDYLLGLARMIVFEKAAELTETSA